MPDRPLIDGDKNKFISRGMNDIKAEDLKNIFEIIYKVKSDPDACIPLLIKLIETNTHITQILTALSYGDHNRAEELVIKYTREKKPHVTTKTSNTNSKPASNAPKSA